jgi:hypothetical protein
MSSSHERIWYEDPRGFFRDDRLSHFVPERGTSLASQLNAAMRFAVYLAVFVALYRRSLAPSLTILAASAAVTWAIYRAESSGRAERLERMRSLDLQEDAPSGRLCVRPTVSNPYMNVLLTDYGRFPERPSACDITRVAVRDRADGLAARGLFQDSEDLYGRGATFFQPWVTNPSTTIPNDQGGFARWLYRPSGGEHGTCHEGNGNECMRMAVGA